MREGFVTSTVVEILSHNLHRDLRARRAPGRRRPSRRARRSSRPRDRASGVTGMTAGAASERLIGRRLLRQEDPRLLTGRGAYVTDLALPGMLHMALLRSPHAPALIAHVDVDRARRVPGVVGVIHVRDERMSGGAAEQRPVQHTG